MSLILRLWAGSEHCLFPIPLLQEAAKRALQDMFKDKKDTLSAFDVQTGGTGGGQGGRGGEKFCFAINTAWLVARASLPWTRDSWTS
jgi:hypothetical protein